MTGSNPGTDQASPSPAPHSPATLLSRMLETTEKDIIPLTRAGVSSGSKVFGAAILTRADLAPQTVATNNERASPLLHGEINCIQTFFAEGPPHAAGRPATRDCLFFATHEPCSLCLSAVAWAGFGELYFLFTHADSRDLFAIPHDVDILEQVFRVPAPADTAASLAARPLYNRRNRFFHARSLAELVDEVGDPAERERWRSEVARVKALYGALSETYQEGKRAGTESASVWT